MYIATTLATSRLELEVKVSSSADLPLLFPRVSLLSHPRVAQGLVCSGVLHHIVARYSNLLMGAEAGRGWTVSLWCCTRDPKKKKSRNLIKALCDNWRYHLYPLAFWNILQILLPLVVVA